MKVNLFRELLTLNVEFDQLIAGLARMEKVPTRSEMIRWARAHVESAQVEANRQFFEQFDEIVEKNATDAYRFLREHTKQITDPDDIYLEIKHREEASKAKGLPPRLVILPDWDFDDEKRHDKEQAEKRNQTGKKAHKDEEEASTEGDKTIRSAKVP